MVSTYIWVDTIASSDGVRKVCCPDGYGADAKVIAVPHEKLSSMYSNVKECSDLPALLLAQIQHFFENYKALEPGKWVKMGRWGSADEAREDIRKSVAAYNLKKEACK